MIIHVVLVWGNFRIQTSGISFLVSYCLSYLVSFILSVHARMFLGDGAGVGKGRTVAGIIYQNYLEGRKKALWLATISWYVLVYSLLVLG